MPMTFSGRIRKTNQMSYAIAIKAIVTQPHSLAQLMELTGLSKRSVVDLLKSLQSQKLIHTAAWGPDSMGRLVLNVWGWGDLPDAPKPPPKTGAQSQKKHRDRKRQQRKAAGTVFASIVGSLAPPK